MRQRLGDNSVDLDDLSFAEQKKWIGLLKQALEQEHTAWARPAADWMLSEFNRVGGVLVQRQAAIGIHATFGSDFTYKNAQGNLAINSIVLREFRKLTEESIVWEKDNLRWRARSPDDPRDKRSV